MRGIVADLLDAGRIRTGTLSVSPVPAEVRDLVEQARSAFLNGGLTHAVLVDLPQDLPTVLADGPRIVQVLSNLLANAARHSPASSPIRIAAVRDGPHVAVSVSDDGRGVPTAKLPHLFRKHVGPGGDDATHGLGGPGLGLAICKGLVEAHGGRIRAESGGQGQGARFTFTVPAVADAARAPGVGGASPMRAARQNGQAPILVVDDDPRTLRFVRDALTQAGFAPVATGDPSEIPKIVRAERPCLVLLDLMLPGADGIELMETVPELSDVPVIFISAYGRDETVARALELGAADYLVKPFSATELTARIQAALRKHAEPETFMLGDLAVIYAERRVTVAGRPARLTATEYELLRLLTKNAGHVSTYESLIRQLWNGNEVADPDRVRTFVKQLRRKLGDDPKRPAWIQNERGVGYRVPRPE